MEASDVDQTAIYPLIAPAVEPEWVSETFDRQVNRQSHSKSTSSPSFIHSNYNTRIPVPTLQDNFIFQMSEKILNPQSFTGLLFNDLPYETTHQLQKDWNSQDIPIPLDTNFSHQSLPLFNDSNLVNLSLLPSFDIDRSTVAENELNHNNGFFQTNQASITPSISLSNMSCVSEQQYPPQDPDIRTLIQMSQGHNYQHSYPSKNQFLATDSFNSSGMNNSCEDQYQYHNTHTSHGNNFNSYEWNENSLSDIFPGHEPDFYTNLHPSVDNRFSNTPRQVNQYSQQNGDINQSQESSNYTDPEINHYPQHRGKIPTQPRRYQCMICAKKFTRPSTLKTHMNSHTGERPYMCSAPGCVWKFTVLSNLRRHMKVCPLLKDAEQIDSHVKHKRSN